MGIAAATGAALAAIVTWLLLPGPSVIDPREEYEVIKALRLATSEANANGREPPSLQERKRVYFAGLASNARYARYYAVSAIASDNEIDLPVETIREELARCAKVMEEFGDPRQEDGRRSGWSEANECDGLAVSLLGEALSVSQRVDTSSLFHLAERLLPHHRLEVRKAAAWFLGYAKGYTPNNAVLAMVRADGPLMRSGRADELVGLAFSGEPYHKIANELALRYWTGDRVDGRHGDPIRFDALSQTEVDKHASYLLPLLDHPTVLVRLRALRALAYGRGPIPPEVLLRYFDECWTPREDHVAPTAEERADGVAVVHERLILLAETTLQELRRLRERGGDGPDPGKVEHFLFSTNVRVGHHALLYLFSTRGYVPSSGVVHCIKKHRHLRDNFAAELLLNRVEAGGDIGDAQWLEKYRQRPPGGKLSSTEAFTIRNLLLSPLPEVRWRVLSVMARHGEIVHEDNLVWFLSQSPREGHSVVQALSHALRSVSSHGVWRNTALLERHAVSGPDNVRVFALRTLSKIESYEASTAVLESLIGAPEAVRSAGEDLAASQD